MKRKVTAITERTKDGRFSCHIKENLGNYGIAGYGDTAEQARADMLTCYEEMKQLNAADGIETPEFEITYKYDIQSFFSMFPHSHIPTKVGTSVHLYLLTDVPPYEVT